MKSIITLVCIVMTLVGFTMGCGTVGNAFEEKRVDQIQNGSTTKEDIGRLFGKPFRTGIENNREVWIYEYNAYFRFGPGLSKDLIIVFDDQGVVHSHQIMSSAP